MEKLLNLHNNNLKMKNVKPTFYKSLMRVQKNFTQLQGEVRAKYHLEEVKKKFINLLMRNGEKSKAHKVFTDSLDLLEKKSLPMPSTTTPEYTTFDGAMVPKSHSTEKKSEDHKEHSVVCENKTTLFQFYTVYNNVEKYGSFEKNVQLVDLTQTSRGDVREITSTEKNNENKNKGKEENCYNDFLKNNILYQAIENVKPPLELRRVRKGGTTYQVPAIVSQKRQERLAIKWIIESALKRKNKKGNTFPESLVTEILEAFNKTGQPRQKRDEILKIAEYNRAYTRYRWW